MSCKCQTCGAQYRVDLLIPDDIWERIKPLSKPDGAGLLCGSCIMERLEQEGAYGALQVVEAQNSTSNNTGSLQCAACGSSKVNIIHECEDCNAEIDISNWRDRAQQAGA